jgi:hypothetical protein
MASQGAADAVDEDEAVAGVSRFWRYYLAGLLGLGLFAALFGQFFLALTFTADIWQAVVDRLLAISVVALFLERAIEVYVASWRNLGEAEIVCLRREAEEDAPEDRVRLRRIDRRLVRYKLGTQRITFVVGLLFGVLVASTGLRVLDGLILIDDYWKANPVWQTRVWWGVDILLTGGVIGGGAAGIHELVKTMTGRLAIPKA